MTHEQQYVGRLLPRYELDKPILNITWHGDLRRSLSANKNKPDAAVINLSLEGALVEVSGPRTQTVDDVVYVQLHDTCSTGIKASGKAVVRHYQESEHAVRYGLRWERSGALTTVLDASVAYLRGENRSVLA